MTAEGLSAIEFRSTQNPLTFAYC